MARRDRLANFRHTRAGWAAKRIWRLVLLALTLAAWGGAPRAGGAAGPVWARLDLVENTAEGPSYDRCGVEGTWQGRPARRWRVFYGEAVADSGAGWVALRTPSGCAAVASESASNPWTLRGSPYLLVDVALTPTATSDRAVRLEAALTIRRLTGFTKARSPTYEKRRETRTLWVPAGASAVIPILIASKKENEEFRVREVLARVRATDPTVRPRTDYGEIAVVADVPRASIFLDGGFVGRTSAESTVVLGTVPTGEREVIVRDPSGREGRAVAQVEKGGRATVTITLLPPPASPEPGGLRPLGRNRQGGEELWRDKDGAIVVRIPGGEFRMGSTEGEGEPGERPQHAVRVHGFLMDKTEVTWGQYRQFAAQTKRSPPKPPVWGMPEAFPASNITWEDARDFCAWAGGRLPTEAEWERAARGDDARRYPWGNDFDPARCNTQEGGPHTPTATATYLDCVSPYGVLDLAGSMWEWCQDWYDAAYYAHSPVEDPKGPETGHGRVSRGGCWINHSSWVRSATRQGIEPTWPDPTHGFRCAQDDREGTGQ